MISDPGPSRDSLAAQVEALRGLVERQRLIIGSMRESHFWRLRDAVVALRARLFGVPDPLPKETARAEAWTEAALGDPYQLLRLRKRRSKADANLLDSLVPLLPIRHVVEIIVDGRFSRESDLETSLSSLLGQIYLHWHARIWLDPASEESADALRSLAARDARIDPKPWDGSGLGADGSIGCLVAGDVLEAEAFLFVAIEFERGADVVYTDEDALGPEGVCRHPQFKPDWSPESELSRDYVGRLCLFRASAVELVGGLDFHAGSAMWYDVLLRVAAVSEKIVHVAQVLYHRRENAREPDSADVRNVLARELERRGELAVVRSDANHIYPEFLSHAGDHVAVIIPTRDRSDLLERCLSSLFERTTHSDFEVIVVDNGSVDRATHALLERWQREAADRFRVISDVRQFNYSRLNNSAVDSTDARYILLLNNDTEIISSGWMTALLGQARRKEIGAVGALLLYEDETVQHAGVILGGVLGLAGHAYRNFRIDAEPAPMALRYDTNYIAVTGACLMIERRKYLEVGGLDETLAVAFNDVDFCLKLRRAGYRNVVVPGARLYHHESKSRGVDDTREKRTRAFSESETIRIRYPEWSARDPYYNPNLTLDAEDFSVRLDSR